MKIVFATHNLNKLKEVQLLVPPHIQLLSLTDICCNEDIVEDAPTIEGNAQGLKRLSLSQKQNKLTLLLVFVMA